MHLAGWRYMSSVIPTQPQSGLRGFSAGCPGRTALPGCRLPEPGQTRSNQASGSPGSATAMRSLTVRDNDPNRRSIIRVKPSALLQAHCLASFDQCFRHRAHEALHVADTCHAQVRLQRLATSSVNHWPEAPQDESVPSRFAWPDNRLPAGSDHVGGGPAVKLTVSDGASSYKSCLLGSVQRCEPDSLEVRLAHQTARLPGDQDSRNRGGIVKLRGINAIVFFYSRAFRSMMRPFISHSRRAIWKRLRHSMTMSRLRRPWRATGIGSCWIPTATS